MLVYDKHRKKMAQLLEELCKNIKLAENDALLSGLIEFLENLDEESAVKRFHSHVPIIASSVLSCFKKTKSSKTKSKCLHVLYLCFRCISWADGIDNEMIGACLNPTFNEWMSVFLSCVNSQEDNYELKRQTLRCLTVIFRDFMNYSRECINLILRPAW